MERLQLQDAWQKVVLDSADLTIIATDVNGIILSCNASAMRQLGYSEAEFLDGRTPTFMHDPAEIAARAAQLSRELETEIAPGFEVLVAKARRGAVDENDWSYIRKDGSRFWVCLSVTALRDAKGEIKGFLGIGKDITEQREVERALVESEQHFQALANAAFEAIVITQEGKIVDANRSFMDLYGYELHELIGKGPMDVIAEGDRERVLSLVLACEEKPFFFQGLRKDGSVFTGEARGKLISYRGFPARVAAMHDVTERLETEQALRDSEARYRDLFDNASDLIQSVAPDGKLMFVNRAWRETLGYSAEEIPHLTLEQIIHPNSREHCQQMFARVLEGEKLGDIEAIFVAKDGRKIVVEGSSSCRYEHGELVSTRSIFRNITRRKRDEAKIAAQQQKLAAANAHLKVLAITDGLTGLKNRRAFEEHLHHEFERAQRYGTALSLLMLDVDEFKSYNDTFGHPAGDAVLRRVAELLMSVSRTTDVVARYGGEEFVIISPATDCEGAIALAERCREAIENADWNKRLITASVGVATFSSSTATSAALVEAADAALYEAKANGRNRIVHATKCVQETTN